MGGSARTRRGRQRRLNLRGLALTTRLAVSKPAPTPTIDSMKHAGSSALDRLEKLLVQIRQIPALQEKSRGVFYKKSKAMLHFHEDTAGLFADVRIGAEWERLPVNSAAERKSLLAMIKDGTASRGA